MFQRYIKSTALLVRNVTYFHCKSCKSIWIRSMSNGPQFDHQITSRSGDLENNLKRTVPLSNDEYRSFKSIKPSQPEDPHLLKVSILGEPNVGKSTLTNSLVKWRVCAVSRKVHTTRRKAKAVLVDGNTQIVFLDTPGFVTPEKTKRHSLEASFVMDPMQSIREADIIAVVVDIADKWTNNRINSEILRTLYDFKEKKSILVLNKIDALKSKGRLLRLTEILTGSKKEERKKSDSQGKSVTDSKEEEKKEADSQEMSMTRGKKKEKKKADSLEMSVTDILSEANQHIGSIKDVDSRFYDSIEEKRGWPLFSKVFMVSALTNDGVDDLRDYLLSEAVPKDWLFHEGIVTDQHPHDIALMTVRENLLEYLPNEIPYKLNLKITKWEMLSTGCPKIDIKIKCANSRHKSFVIGPNGKHIAACVAKCKKAMRESFRRDVVLKLAVE